MAQAEDYLFLSIETLINTISLIVMLPFMITLVRTRGMHTNCRVLLITSGGVQTLLLIVQCALFVYDYIIENVIHDAQKEKPFLFVQNGLFSMSSCISMFLVLERTFAVRNAAHYETTGHHFAPLILLLSCSIVFACAIVYAINFLFLSLEMIFVIYAVEGFTFLISIVIIVYSRRKLEHMPFDEDRLKAKYQASFMVKEVLRFSIAILPSILLSVFMHTFSLAPTMLWKYGVITYPVCCVFYFSVHSLNCIVTKFTLIVCHKGMRQRFMLIFIKRISTPRGARVRNFEKEGKVYFEQMKAAWDTVPKKEAGKN